MRLKLIHYTDGNRTWVTVVNADTGEMLEGVLAATVTYENNNQVVGVSLRDVAIEVIRVAPPQRREGPDL